MGVLFISHSSRNNGPAIRVRDWLRDQGWRDTFLDLDPEHGLAPGQRWQEELKKAGERCSAVIVLVSPEWNASRWCVTEFLLATQLGKRVFPVLIAPSPFSELPVELTAHFQMADMSRPQIEQDGLNRLRIGLRRAGLDPRDFAWPPPDEPSRPPYRGLRTLEEPDAAVFFGRDAQITKGLDALRRLRDGAPERMLVILGASGSGKSSFLRAGLLARLGRDDENFLLLPIVRPARAALTGPTGLVHALGLPLPASAGAMAVRFAALRQPVLEHLARYAQAGRQTYTARPPTLILPIDQGEELFAAGQAEGAAMCATLANALAGDGNLLVVVTIRSESFGALQAEPALASVPRLPFDLPALPLAAFSEVIEGPGRIARPQIEVEETLTAQLVADLDQADALPLLAFTLERLVADYGADGVLELTEYCDGLGGLDGAIGRAVDAAFAAARDDCHLPGDAAALERLARSAFIPWLLQLEGADQEPKRRVALLREIPPDARPLVAHFVDQRLLVSDIRSDGDTTVEVTHEAVLRHWRLLGRWIGEEREELAQVAAVIRAAADWQRESSGTEQQYGLLVHRGARLASAERLLQRADLTELIGPDGHAYLAACRTAETRRLDHEGQQLRRQRRLQQFVGAAVLLAFVVTLVGAWLVLLGQQDVARKTSRFIASAAHTASDAGRFEQAAHLSLVAARDTWRQPADPEGLRELGDAAYFSWLQAALYGHADNLNSAAFSPDGSRIVTASDDNTARVWQQGADGVWAATVLEGHTDSVNSAAFSPDGSRIVTASDHRTARVWQQGADGVWAATVLEGHTDSVNSAAFSPDGSRIVTASYDRTARVWQQGADGVWAATVLEGHTDSVNSAVFSPDGSRVVTASNDNTARVWRQGADGVWAATVLEGHSSTVNSAVFSPDGSRIVTTSYDDTARVWQQGADGAWTATVLPDHVDSVNSAAFSPDGSRIVTASDDNTARVWQQGADGVWAATILEGHTDSVNSAAFSPDGSRIVTASDDKTARVWRQGAEGTWGATVLEGHTDTVVSAVFSPDGSRIVTASDDNTARVWEIAWLIGDTGRVWANARDPSLRLPPLAEAACAEKLGGTERVVLEAGKETGRESVRQLTYADTNSAPILRGREGEDVCAWQPSLPDQLLTWVFRDLWR